MSVHNLNRDEIDFLSDPKLLTTLSSYDVPTEHDSVPTENMDQAMVKPNDNLKISPNSNKAVTSTSQEKDPSSIKATRPKRGKIKEINYSEMCQQDSSDSAEYLPVECQPASK